MEQQEVDLYTAYFRGKPKTIALSRKEIVSEFPWARRRPWHIVRSIQKVSIVKGEVIDWNKHGGYARKPKIHFRCPLSRFDASPDSEMPEWFDFQKQYQSPIIVYCEYCRGEFHLVHWQNELT